MTQRKPQYGSGMRNLVFRVDTDTAERFREVAEAEHRTVSQELRRLMDLRIAEADELEQAA